MVLIKFNVAGLTHAEAGQLVKTTIKDLQTANIVIGNDANTNKYVIKLQAHTVLYDKGLLQTQQNEESKLLADLDHNRDLDLAIFRRQLKVYSLSRKPEEQQAFQSLNILWGTYKNVTKLNYEAESNTVDNLLQDVETPKFAPHVATLKLGDYLADIEASNNKFKDVFSTRNTEVAAEEDLNMKVIRRDTFKTYNNFINYVHALADDEETPADFYTPMLNIINTSRKYYADLLAKRNGGSDPTPPPAK
jgi:hypothetical protein